MSMWIMGRVGGGSTAGNMDGRAERDGLDVCVHGHRELVSRVGPRHVAHGANHTRGVCHVGGRLAGALASDLGPPLW